MNYGIALLAAALVLFAWWLIRHLRKKTTPYTSFDSDQISEKLNNLFAEKANRLTVCRSGIVLVRFRQFFLYNPQAHSFVLITLS